MSGQEGAGRCAGPMSQAAARRKADRWSKAPVNRGEKKLGDNQPEMCGEISCLVRSNFRNRCKGTTGTGMLVVPSEIGGPAMQ